ncbi:uncharacterized protein EAF02_004126 [Botrytis sinoallii]|uniref:uncharacterized protein n=1 Tax=Botrytis sinoallii TaxID=1463999 RepID=UPI0019024CC2|nr:uncharacterized protein EAF02_004126 [Botrytis sinoallii]KAF7885617.1 hypothetical protein EAF02_004126 [Botrytis sinoallii]
MPSRRDPTLGPRVSISSFGPTIEHPKCGYCTKDASIPCTTCNATWYCTVACQRVDRDVHDIICQKFADFVAAHPCPDDTAEKKYRLGLLLPVDSEDFELAWIANGSNGKSVATFLQYYDQDRINTRSTLVDYNMASKKFDHSIILAVRGDFLTDNSPPNACINHIIDGNMKFAFKGPVAVVRERGWGSVGSAQHFQPCDFRILIDFLFNYEGKPNINIGHACGEEPKNILGTSVSRVLKFLKGKAQDGKRKSKNAPLGGEERRTYRKRAETFAEPDWMENSETFLPRHKMQRSKSSINLGSFRDDASSLHKAESFVMPDFLPDWIRESVSIAAGPRTHSEIATSLSINTEKAFEESDSIFSTTITPISPVISIAATTKQARREDNVSVRGSLDIFDLYNSNRNRGNHDDSASILSSGPSPSILTTTSFFQPKTILQLRPTIRKVKDSSTLNRKSSLFSRPKSKSVELNRDHMTLKRSMTGSIMSPWTV